MSSGTASTGQMLELAAAVTRALPRDIGSDCAQYWVEPHGEELTALLRQVLLRDNNKATSPLNIVTYSAEVNYNLAVEKAVRAGNYDWSNSDITAGHFPITKSGKAAVKVELVHFAKTMSSDKVLAELDAQGLRPAEFHELLALGAAHPELQREFPIIALGSVWLGPHGYRRVASLDRGGSERSLLLDWFGSDWLEGCRFAAVRK